MSRNTKIWILSISTAVLLVALGFLLGHNPCSDIDNFVKGEVMKQLDERDSILTKQVQKYADTCTVNINVDLYQLDSCTETKIKYLVSEASRENLGQYINEENNHLTWLAIIIAALVSIVGIGIPLFINSDMKRQIEEIKKKVDEVEKAKVATVEAKDKAEAAKQDAEKANEEAKESEKAAKASELFAQALAEKDLDKKIELYSKVLDLDSNSAEALNNRGCAYLNKGDNDQAIKDFNDAIKLNPNYSKAYYNRGIAFGKKGDDDEAIKNYDEAIRINPKDDSSYCNKGMAYSRKNDPKQAIENFMKAVELEPDEINTNNLELGYVLQSAKTFKGKKVFKMARSKAEEGLKKAEGGIEWVEIFQKFLDKLPPEE